MRHTTGNDDGFYMQKCCVWSALWEERNSGFMIESSSMRMYTGWLGKHCKKTVVAATANAPLTNNKFDIFLFFNNFRRKKKKYFLERRSLFACTANALETIHTNTRAHRQKLFFFACCSSAGRPFSLLWLIVFPFFFTHLCCLFPFGCRQITNSVLNLFKNH